MGGLPGVCFIRDSALRSARLKEQLQLMLDRDLRLVYPSSVPYLQIFEFAHSLAQQEGEPYQPTITRKLTGLAEATQKKLLQALEAIFLIRLMSIEGDKRGLCVYFEDQAEHLFLAQERFDQLKAFEGLVYRNMRASFAYEAGYDYRVFQFRERPDVRIPYVFKSRNGSLGVLPILESSPSSKALRMANRFLQKYNHSHILIVALGQCQSKIIDSRILQIPAEKLLLE